MNNAPLPLTRDLVLIGGGHAHALVLLKWGMSPLPGARLSLISPAPTAAYSGMLPGFVAGHYDRDALDIDLVRLARFAGARLILGTAHRLDPVRRQVHVEGRPPLGYDLCSIDVGITSEMPGLPGFAEHGIPAKPLDTFAARWDAYRAGTGPAAVAVVGAGVAGVELVLAMAHALRTRGRAAQVSLIDSAQALSGVAPRVRSRLLAALMRYDVTLIENAGVARVGPDHVTLSDGREVASDFTTGAAGARPHDWLADAGLEMHEGFVAVGPTLQSSDAAVFAVGDCAHLSHDPRPKAGVYAVREAPVLHDNLLAALTGGRMRAYRPQKAYLKLISMGGKRAVAERFGLSPGGAAMWRWKDHIDRKFMNRFRDLPEMKAAALPRLHADGMAEALGDRPLCGGCGAKVGRTPLRAALAGLPGATRADVTPLPGDDAALLSVGGARQVLTSDHLRSLTADPVLMTRIAAVHALGDIWAMGAAPQAATVTLILPRLSGDLQARTLAEVMAVASEVMAEAGADIVGGHTSVGSELTVGFSITGLCESDPLTLAGARVGDALILTKPLGSGVLMAAEMAGRARGDRVAAAWDRMVVPQSGAARILAPAAHAMTDVTGFGLAGHLLGICEASGVGAVLDPEAVPVMDGAVELAVAGVRSSLFPENRAVAPDLAQGGRADLLFDPQTAGGLLAAVPMAEAEGLVAALREAGHDAAAVIGRMVDGPARVSLASHPH